ncbi:MAG TPA: GWxTD domain-containing protein [Terriglobales bacterium]|nr:GWxTD domain-containing protein [Terriglobales bacterium]
MSVSDIYVVLRRSLLRKSAALIPLLLLSIAALGSNTPKLPLKYSQWLKKDVGYIITNEEREAFKGLTTDEARDKFIEHFWEIRNPNPGAPTNPYRDEHYERLQYASDHFGKFGDGWNTDMGRIYITLGPPQQKARYVAQSGVRGMEIWFFSSSHPALPPFFYIVFYEKDMGDFRLYSPYMDGPNKLVTGIQAEQGRVQSVLQIDHLLGREVARTTLSLLPDEPVNLNDANSTLLSDLMLGTIHDLANHPFTVEALKLRQALSEDVTHRVVLPGDLLNVMCVPLRDAHGNVRLHYALRLAQPEDFAVAQADNRYYYSLDAIVRVLGADGKEIFNREQKLTRYLTKEDLDSSKNKPVTFQGWVPLAPGKYTLKFNFTNLLTKTTFPAEREVTVPEVGAQGFVVTAPVPFSQADQVDPAKAEFLPFTAGGIRFRPYVAKELALVPGQDLKFFYQIWRTQPAKENSDAKLQIDYAYGRPSYSGTAKTIHEELPTSQFDVYGSMVNGKKIQTTEMGAGNYRLTISVTDPATQQKRFDTMSFQIVGENPSPAEVWQLDDEGLADYVRSGQSDFDRGLTYLAKGDSQAAIGAFTEALHKDPTHERARARLADYYFQKQQFGKVVELFAHNEVTEKTDEVTILAVADSLDRTGRSSQAVDLLESALKVRPPSGPLYLALGAYYLHLGKNDRAESFQNKGRALMSGNGSKTDE